MNVPLGDGDVLEERVPDHPDVAVGVVRRNEPLVGPEEMDAAPGDRVAKAGGEGPVERAGSSPAGKSHREPASAKAFAAATLSSSRSLKTRM